MECMRRIQVNRELPDASRLTLSLCRARSQLHGGGLLYSLWHGHLDSLHSKDLTRTCPSRLIRLAKQQRLNGISVATMRHLQTNIRRISPRLLMSTKW